jgi:molybdate transport system regulatory protein
MSRDVTRHLTSRAPRVSLRLDFAAGRLGPGKIALLEAIGREGSLAGAARALDMSYKRAWDLVGELDTLFVEPVVISTPGRNTGGGTALTAFGARVVALYRAAERRATAAADAAMQELAAATRLSARAAARPAQARRSPRRRA